MKEDEQIDYDNLTRKQKKAVGFLNYLWENGITQNNFTGDHSEYSEILLILSKLMK
jgi:hypothetical protein